MMNEKIKEVKIEEIIEKLRDEKTRERYLGRLKKKLFHNDFFYIFKRHGMTFYVFEDNKMDPNTWNRFTEPDMRSSCVVFINSPSEA